MFAADPLSHLSRLSRFFFTGRHAMALDSVCGAGPLRGIQSYRLSVPFCVLNLRDDGALLERGNVRLGAHVLLGCAKVVVNLHPAMVLKATSTPTRAGRQGNHHK
jgi:hypothetical protein